MKLLYTNSGEPDQTPHVAASDLVLHCLLMSHKRTPGLYGLTYPPCFMIFLYFICQPLNEFYSIHDRIMIWRKIVIILSPIKETRSATMNIFRKNFFSF